MKRLILLFTMLTTFSVIIKAQSIPDLKQEIEQLQNNTNDEDVNVMKVEQLIKSLNAKGKPFEFEIFEAVPGRHSFDLMDTKTAKKISLKIQLYLSKYLKPENSFKSIKDL